MSFSDFKRLLRADPRNRDAEFLRARQSSPEFAAAAAEADRFEHQLQRALALPVPAGLATELLPLAQRPHGVHPGWRNFALAASVLLAVTVGLLFQHFRADSAAVEQFVAEHYRSDGAQVAALGHSQSAPDVEALLARMRLSMAPEVASRVGYVKVCPTLAGEGLHLLVNTDLGPVTVIVIPDTQVPDGKRFDFDQMRAQLVQLVSGSAAAAVVAREEDAVTAISAVVRESLKARSVDT